MAHQVILVVRKSAAKDLRLGMEKHSVSLEIDLVTILDESDMGTVESLRLIKDKIFTDFIVMSAGNPFLCHAPRCNQITLGCKVSRIIAEQSSNLFLYVFAVRCN